MPAFEVTDLQRRIINAIVSIFETDTIAGAYSSVVFAIGDKGQLTYGKHQTTLTSGNLAKLVTAYIAQPGAVFASELGDYVPRLKAQDEALNHDTYLKNLLRAAADDPLMRQTQDDFFTNSYQVPAFQDAARRGFQEALSWCVRYDGQVQGSWSTIAAETDADAGAVTPATERNWISTYVALRRKFLANGAGILPNTVYRMDAIRALIDINAWDLALPLVVRGHEVTDTSLAALPLDVYHGPALGSRIIKVGMPIMAGLDVRRVQLALSRPGVGFDVSADGKYGRMTSQTVATFQRSRSLDPSGEVDQPTIDALKA